MFEFYCGLSKAAKVFFLIITIFLSLHLGGITGLLEGLAARNFPETKKRFLNI